MLAAYFKIVLRLIFKYKRIHAIGIAGLSMGLAVVLTLGAYCVREYNFDLFNRNANQIYQLWATIQLGTDEAKIALFSKGTGEEVQRENAGVDEIVRTSKAGPSTLKIPGAFGASDLKGIFAGPALFHVFTFPIKAGTAGTLSNPGSIMISESMASRFFHDADPNNEIILYNDSITLKVAGIFENIPQNSTLQFDYVISENTKSILGRPMIGDEAFGPGSYQTYLLLREDVHPGEIESRLPELTAPFVMGKYHLDRLKGMHIRNYGDSSRHPFWVFSLATLALLVVVTINFINILITQNIERSKEIMIRKINGASRPSIILLFYVEALLVTTVAVFIAFLTANAASNFFQSMLSVNLQIVDFANGRFLFIAGCAFLVIVAVSGLYPLLVLSKTLPISSLSSSFSSSGLALQASRLVMVIQLIASTGLIMSIVVINKQLVFLEKDDLGMKIDDVVTFAMDATDAGIYNGLRNELLAINGVESIGASSVELFNSEPPITMISRADSSGPLPVSIMIADSSFLSTLDIRLKSKSVNKHGIILNSTAAKAFSFGQNIDHATLQMGKFPAKVAGVVTDFNFVDKRRHVGSLAISMADDSSRVFSYTGCVVYIKVASPSDATSQAIRSTCEKYLPGKQISLAFLADKIARMYKAEHSMLKSFTFFTTIGIAISLFGVVALLLFNIARRMKGLSIRKVLGADATHLSYVLAKDTIQIILVGSLIGVSLSSYFLNAWLDEFAYKTSIGIADLLISIATISFCVLIVCIAFIRKAIVTNPVRFLRAE